MKNKKLIVLMFFFFSIASIIFTQNENNNQILKTADEAIKTENWERAIKILTNGIKKYPNDDRILFKLGKIYYDKEIYKLAYKYFKKSLNINKENSNTLFYISYTAGYLNQDNDALQYIKEYLKLTPYDRGACSTYGWLCFKTHRIQEGITALLENIKKYGEHSSIYNALGTLYSEIFDYENSVKYYKRATNLAKKKKKHYSASIYFYNKAILESDFYNFEQALKDAETSLEMQKRNSGYVMIGELEERRNNFVKALEYYSIAIEMDDTPISGLNSASLFLGIGDFEKAEPILRSIIEYTNEHWLANYGMSVNEFKSTLYKKLKDLYQLKYNFEKTKLNLNVSEYIQNIKNKINYKLKYLYYEAVSRIYELKVVDEFKHNQNMTNDSYELHINSHYYMALENKGNKALKYLQKAEQIETMFIPKASGNYIAEKAIILKDLSLLNTGINKMNFEWEKYLLKDLYAKGIIIAKNKSPSFYYFYTECLFNTNPSGFLQYDIKLPVKIKIIDDKNLGISKRKIKKIINSARFIEDENAPFNLILIPKNNNFVLELKNKNGYTINKKQIATDKIDKKILKDAINKLSKELFIINL